MTTDEARRARQQQLINDTEELIAETRELVKGQEADRRTVTAVREDNKRWKKVAITGLIFGIVGILVGLLGLLGLYENNKERSDRRAQVNNQISQLACLLISQTPDNPKIPLIHEFRVRYGCPPYSKENADKAKQSLGRATTVPKASPHPSATPSTVVRTIHRNGTTTITAPGGTLVITHNHIIYRTRTRIITVTCALVVSGKCINPFTLVPPRP